MPTIAAVIPTKRGADGNLLQEWMETDTSNRMSKLALDLKAKQHKQEILKLKGSRKRKKG